MVNKDQTIGGLICIVCIAIAIAYTTAIFWPALEAIRLWLIGIPVFIAFIAVLGIGAWIGWTMATTPPPKPLEEIPLKQTEEEGQTEEKEKE